MTLISLGVLEIGETILITGVLKYFHGLIDGEKVVDYRLMN